MFWIGGFGENFLVFWYHTDCWSSQRVTSAAFSHVSWPQFVTHLDCGIQQGSVSMEDGSAKNDPCSARLGFFLGWCTCCPVKLILLLVAIEWLQLFNWHRATELPRDRVTRDGRKYSSVSSEHMQHEKRNQPVPFLTSFSFHFVSPVLMKSTHFVMEINMFWWLSAGWLHLFLCICQ